MKVAGAGGLLLDLLLPPSCIACGAYIPRASGTSLVCRPCLSRLHAPPSPRCSRCDHPLGTGDRPGRKCPECQLWPTSLTWARCAAALEPPADVIVHALKYEGWKELAPVMADRMARCLLPPLVSSRRRIIVHVPTSRDRRRRRGYDQAEVLAEALSRRLGSPHVPALTRASGGRSQVSLHPEQRLANVQQAFSLQACAHSRLRGADVVLVDDVMTTGATGCSAAEALARAEPRAIALVTFARAVPRRDAHHAHPASQKRA